MCLWDGARPGRRGRRELEEGDGVREPDRKASAGRGVREDLLIQCGLAAFLIFVAKLQDSI